MLNLHSVTTIIILTTLLAVLSSLGFGLFYLLYDKGAAKRTVKALTWRVGLSMSLFMSLLFAIQSGWIVPNPHPF